MLKYLSELKKVYEILERLGYKPVVVGTYALILHGWLPNWYEDETKDIDVYVDDPMAPFDERLERELVAAGYSIGRSESGGFYVDVGKAVEILYPVFDIFIPSSLLERVEQVEGMKVLEPHAVLVAKTLGGRIEHLAHILAETGVDIDTELLTKLVERLRGEIPSYKYMVAKRRVEEFIRSYRELRKTRVCA